MAMSPRLGKNKKQIRGFTLIELLVVIAVIAVLMGILMPALRRVREQARMTRCTANMKHWAAFLHMRADENDGVLFTGNSNGHWWIGELADKDLDWKQNKTWFCPTATKPVIDQEGGILNDYTIYNAWGIFMNGGDYDFGPHGISGSYGLNSYFLKSTRDTWGSGVPASDGWRNFYQVKKPTRVPLFLDALRFDLWPAPDDAANNDESRGWKGATDMARACINRHQGFVCSAFADGSARKVGLKELYVLKWHKRFDTAGPYTIAGGVTAEKWPKWLRRYADH